MRLRAYVPWRSVRKGIAETDALTVEEWMEIPVASFLGLLVRPLWPGCGPRSCSMARLFPLPGDARPSLSFTLVSPFCLGAGGAESARADR